MATLLGLLLLCTHAQALVVGGLHAAARAPLPLRMALSEGDEVLVVGRGPVMILAAKLAACRGFKTTGLIGTSADVATAQSLVADPELPLTLLPVSGEEADAEKIEAAVGGAAGVIIAFDGEETVPQRALEVFMPPSGQPLKHVSIMSRHLNGDGMGFFANAAKAAANADIWAAGKMVGEYEDMEKRVKARAAEVGASYTIVRAGTLKGGGCGDPLSGSGDAQFLHESFYTMGQQDIVNWKMLFDCDTLGVTLQRGDVMPGPGFTAALTATSDKAAQGDSGRGAVATALVEALRVEAAANADFGVGTAQSRVSPTAEEWAKLFANA